MFLELAIQEELGATVRPGVGISDGKTTDQVGASLRVATGGTDANDTDVLGTWDRICMDACGESSDGETEESRHLEMKRRVRCIRRKSVCIVSDVVRSGACIMQLMRGNVR